VTATRMRANVGLYVYGVTWAGARVRGRGVANSELTTVEHGELAAIVSDISTAPLRAKRRDLLRHSDVLQRAFADVTVVPLRFGSVFESGDAVAHDLLAARYEELVALLRRIEGLAELRVRAQFVERAILAEVVAADRHVAALREATQSLRGGDPRLVELGEAVARGVADRRAAAADEIVEALAERATDVQIDEPREEWEIVRASALVERRDVTRVERAIESLARRHAGRMSVELIGPMPAHSFVSLDEPRRS
jgi:hypothetical protein